MSYRYQGNKSAPQNGEHMIEVARSDGTMPPLLFDLLRVASATGLERFIIDILPFKSKGVIDEKGNFSIRIGSSPKTMFSCHMDTVHNLDVKTYLDNNTKPILHLLTKDPVHAPSKDTGIIWAATRNLKTKAWIPFVLGADDKAGIFTMCEMIKAGINGLYVFHVGEESGGIGSHYIAARTPEFVKGIERCIAFDRKDYCDVIEFQNPGRCASSDFTAALAAQLNAHIDVPGVGYKFKGGARGTFTDSASYRDLIPECVNLSVGYFDQHTTEERLDVWWLVNKFIPAALEVKWDELPTKRDPKEIVTYPNLNHGYDWYSPNKSYSSPKVALPNITKYTAKHSLPVWNPGMGYLIECTHEGMLRLVENWYELELKPKEAAINLITNLLLNQAVEESGGDDKIIDFVSHKEAKALITVVDTKFQEDDKGFPQNMLEYEEHVNVKRKILEGLYRWYTPSSLNTNQRVRMKQNHHKFNKINNNLLKLGPTDKISKKVYVVLNRLLVESLMLIGDIKKQPPKCLEYVSLGNQYIEGFPDEKGIAKEQ